ncbi:uncharacterized protein LOC126664889 [Mercurialis annua]|uniref:uncharacterized protein LOC126664889 n=1 Tax=Mercurialis annua TaxID=3986 RepID=UPI00215DFDF8|nr:uncharacterized protein LOC126664889 [Mercurialis annua]
MDLDEWEILPHHGGFLDYHEDDDHGGKKKKSFASTKHGSNQRSMFNMNYFVCPSSPPKNSRPSQQLVPVPFQLEPAQELCSDKKPIDIKVVIPSMIIPEINGSDQVAASSKEAEADQDPISQVFFKKMKENKFVDMKLDSPESPTKGFVHPPSPQIDAAQFKFEDKGEVLEINKTNSPRIEDQKEKIWEGDDDDGLNLWKWSLNGIGAICSFGVAAATVCIIIFGSQQRNNQQKHQNQKFRFQIYTDDKRIKQVVHHATRFNEAITAVRGVPIARAHITYGGYYEGI